LETSIKVNKNQFRQKYSHYHQSESRHGGIRTETTRTADVDVSLDYEDGASSATNSALYSNCVTAGKPIATTNFYEYAMEVIFKFLVKMCQHS